MKKSFWFFVTLLFLSLSFNEVVAQCTTPAQPTVSNVTITCGDSAVISATGAGADFNWYSDPAGTNLVFTGAVYTTEYFGTDTMFYVTAFNPPNCESTPVLVEVFVDSIPTPSVTANPTLVTCGNTSELTAIGSGGDIFWYDDPAGTNQVEFGNIFITPPLGGQTTYYVQEEKTYFNGGSGPAQSYSFTTAGATGRTGPTQAQINTAYGSTSLAGSVVSVGGIQEWTVPFTGTYTITAAGAQGGGANGGLGAEMTGDFTLNAGDVVRIAVGQQGLTQAGQPNSVGGGGGSFVVVSPGNNLADILVIAGGGGGAPGTYSTNMNAPITNNGLDGAGANQGAAGGLGGNGGAATQKSGGGGGFLTNGASSTQTAASAEGGFSFINGALGGNHNTNGVEGSFGGGGATWQTGFRGAGGGGGFSGGGGGQVNSDNTNLAGGGGGSINNGTNQINTAGSNSGDGFVTISVAGSGGTCLSAIASITIDVDSLPTPSASADPNPVICGSTTSLIANGAGGTYNWYDNPAGTNLIGTGDTIPSPPINGSETFYLEEISGAGLLQVFEFTNAGATGRFGPTQAQVNTAYTGTSLDGNVTSLNGIQQWVAPVTGTYIIEAAGAQGFGNFGGRGAVMTGEFNLNAGDVLNILVGQEGGCCIGSGTNQHGGGGGSFVVDATNNPLIVAGGGGGSWASSFNAITDAPITQNGNNGFDGPTNGNGGVGGNGGQSVASTGGGGGFLTDATLPNTPGGLSFLNGGQGGFSTTSGGEGGFGGGGGANSWNNRRSGGGGGYSGGGGAGSSTTVFPQGGGGGSFNDGTNQVNLPGENLGHGYVTITVGGLGSCISNLVEVTVNSTPLTFNVGTSTDPSACGVNDGTITLTGLTPDETFDVSYNNGAASSFTSDTNGDLIITGLGAGQYTDFEIEIGGCTANSSQTITLVEPNIPPVDAGLDFGICAGDQVTLTANNLNNANISWNNNVDDGVAFTGPIVTTTYVVTAELNGCINQDSLEIVVTDLPNIDAGSDEIICDGSQFTLTANNPDNASIVWDNGVTDGVPFTPAVGTLTYTVTATLNGCVNSDQMQIEVDENPVISAVSTDLTTCVNNDGTVTISGLNPNEVYEISVNGNFPSPITTSASGTIEFGNLSPNTYTYQVINSNGCVSNTVSVTINAASGPQILAPVVSGESCFGEEDGSIQLVVNGGIAPYTYNWTPNVGNGDFVTGLTPGSYEVTIIDASGCSTSGTYMVDAAQVLTMNPTVQNTFCSNDDGEINLNVQGGTGAYSYAWTPNTISGGNPSDLEAGEYSVVVTDGNGCQISGEFEVEIDGIIEIDILPFDPLILQGDSIQLFVNTSSLDTNLTYIWTPVDSTISCVDCPDPVFSPWTTQTYYITVLDDEGCFGFDSVTVEVKEPCIKTQLPNVFSPNGDGLNDRLCILGDCHISVTYEIYSRWGEVIFSTTNPNECWNGTYKNTLVESGVYVYKLVYMDEFNKEHVISGNVTVLR